MCSICETSEKATGVPHSTPFYTTHNFHIMIITSSVTILLLITKYRECVFITFKSIKIGSIFFLNPELINCWFNFITKLVYYYG